MKWEVQYRYSRGDLGVGHGVIAPTWVEMMMMMMSVTVLMYLKLCKFEQSVQMWR